jgi:hypothetical protein
MRVEGRVVGNRGNLADNADRSVLADLHAAGIEDTIVSIERKDSRVRQNHLAPSLTSAKFREVLR